MMDTPHPMLTRYPDAAAALTALPAAERETLLAAAQVARLAAGTALFSPGDACTRYLVVLDGVVRVFLLSETGREILLYRVGGGQTCVLTTAALLADKVYDAEGVAETDVTALLIPAERFQALLTELPAFRGFVFSSFATRLRDLVGLVGEVAFARLDARLAGFLLKRAGDEETVALTHQEMAAQLGSTREAVSRLLKDFERQGMVVLRRGAVRLRDAGALRRLAEGAM
ncbi:MAG TPA: Crp/Fnr family transcriptional regulator [Thermopetrobacter sp.]|nr:Crp/Fnr family transcriptional regulator [Thermopetrobacter sp.]